jgi:hypothetical protein
MASLRANGQPGLTTQTLDTIADLVRLLWQWWALWDRCPSATSLQSPAWLLPWWRAFQPGELLIVTVRQDDRLVGLGPFYIEDGAHGRRILPLGIGVSDYLDVLIDPQTSDEAVTALVDHVTAQADRWDSWDLEELAPDAAAWALPRSMDLTETVDPQSVCPVLTLPRGSAPTGDDPAAITPQGVEPCPTSHGDRPHQGKLWDRVRSDRNSDRLASPALDSPPPAGCLGHARGPTVSP